MGLTNEHQRVAVPLPDGRSAEGIVQVRAIKLRLGRGVLVMERRRPVAMLIRTAGTLRRVAIDDQRAGPPPWAYAAPVVVYLLMRLVRR
jgi:hypothetical protein